jgi:hypothetical protein
VGCLQVGPVFASQQRLFIHTQLSIIYSSIYHAPSGWGRGGVGFLAIFLGQVAQEKEKNVLAEWGSVVLELTTRNK